LCHNLLFPLLACCCCSISSCIVITSFQLILISAYYLLNRKFVSFYIFYSFTSIDLFLHLYALFRYQKNKRGNFFLFILFIFIHRHKLKGRLMYTTINPWHEYLERHNVYKNRFSKIINCYTKIIMIRTILKN